MKTLKKKITTIIVMAFVAFSFGAYIFPTTVFAAPAPSISIGDPVVDPTNGQVTYSVTYSAAAIITLDASNVTLNKTGTANASSVQVTAGIGTQSRTITISGISGTGSLGISISANTAYVVNGQNKAYAGAAGPSRTFTVDNKFDKTKPVITLNGAAKVTVGVGSSYTDAGATAVDNYDGNITSKIVKNGLVDTSKVGSYTLTYDVTDTNGNKAAQVTRIVNVAVLPAISLDTNVIKVKVNDVYGKMYFLSTASVTEGFNLVECGVVMAKDITGGLDLNNYLVKLPAQTQSLQGQFYSLFNVSYDLTIHVRSYITYKDANGVINTRYSNIVDEKVSK